MSSNARAGTQPSTDSRIPDWIGTNDLLGIWLHDLKRARPHFTSALQRFAKYGSNFNSRGLTIVRSTEHAMLLIACPHIFSVKPTHNGCGRGVEALGPTCVDHVEMSKGRMLNLGRQQRAPENE